MTAATAAAAPDTMSRSSSGAEARASTTSGRTRGRYSSWGSMPTVTFSPANALRTSISCSRVEALEP